MRNAALLRAKDKAGMQVICRTHEQTEPKATIELFHHFSTFELLLAWPVTCSPKHMKCTKHKLHANARLEEKSWQRSPNAAKQQNHCHQCVIRWSLPPLVSSISSRSFGRSEWWPIGTWCARAILCWQCGHSCVDVTTSRVDCSHPHFTHFYHHDSKRMPKC